jgi:hypothetical protein
LISPTFSNAMGTGTGGPGFDFVRITHPGGCPVLALFARAGVGNAGGRLAHLLILVFGYR